MNIDRFIRSCASWDDFSQRMRPLSNGDKGRIFERLTQLYLQTQPKYRTTLRDVWLREEVPSKVRAKLNFPTTDEGIDLIARDRRGKYWSIQAKWRTETNQALTLSLTDSFTRCSFVTCRKINFALIADNKTKPIAKSKFLRNMGEIGFDGWASADWSLITRAIKDKRPVAPKPATPRLDQLRAIEAAKVHFLRDKQSRGRLIAPCGTGKSLDGFWIAEALKAKTVVVIVPNLGLIEQGVRDWMKEFLARGRKPEWICICSDDSVDSTQKDEIVSSVYATGLPVDTDPKVVADFLRGRTNETKVIFSTYQSGKQLAAAARRAGITLDLVIFDEAHRTAGLRNNTFATLLNARKLKARWRLFMTATERVVRFNGDDEVYSMDNEDDYGKCFFEMNVKEAIAAPAADGTKGIISDYEILTMVVSDHEIKQHIAKNRLLNLTRKLTDAEAREVATGIALKRVYQKHCIGHALSFHRSIAAAKSFSVQQSKLNGIPPHVTNFHVNGGQTAGERKILLDKYRASPRALMTKARCLLEGIDVPAIDCVVFADPRQSMTDIVQAAGRAMRKADGKKCGYILVPIVVPDKVDFKEFAETTTFRTVMRVIVALAESDDRIKDELRAICHGHVSKSKIIHIDSKLLIGLTSISHSKNLPKQSRSRCGSASRG
jgi:predicted helicase